MKKTVFAAVFFCMFIALHGQNYQAIHGSSYAGSLGTYNNPASGIHSPFNWDVTLFSAQSKSSTNAFSSTHPLIKLPQASVYLSNGDKERHVHANQDVHVLNARLKLNQYKAVAFGLNVRNYVHVRSKNFKFLDTISSFNSFLQFNRPVPSLGGMAINNGWAEAYLSYSQVVRKTDIDQLSAGITIKATRGVSGVYGRVDNLKFTEVPQPGQIPMFLVTEPIGSYGYSSNYDRLDDNSKQNANDFLVYTQGSFGVDIGVEYLLKGNYAPQFDAAESELDYDWKIGVSLLDLGRNKFKHGRYSAQFNGAATAVNEVELENKFSSPDDIEDFYDSLRTVVTNLQSPDPDYHIWQPTRLVINVDKWLGQNLFINGEVNINFFATSSKTNLHTRELNLLTVTPRWETSMLGLYLPIQLNTQGQLWIGSAFKVGPLLLGIHDWRWLLSKNQVFNGGAYFAIVLRNFFNTSGGKERNIKYMECPPDQIGKRKRN